MDWNNIGSSLVTGFAGGLLDTGFGLFTSNQQLKNQKELMHQQFDLQKQMFDYTAEYNSPTNQVQRLRAAGLNPNLAYGNGAAAGSTGSTGSISQGQAQQAVRGSVDLAKYSQIQQANAMAAKAESDTRVNASVENLNNANADYLRYKAIWQAFENVSQGVRAKFAKEFVESELLQMRANLDYTGAKTIEAQNNAALYVAVAATEVARKENLTAQTSKVFSDIMRNQVLNNLDASTMELNAAKISEIQSNISYRDALILQAEATIEFIKQQKKTEEQKTAIEEYYKENWYQLKNNEIAEQTSRIYNNYKSQSSLDLYFVGGSHTTTIKHNNNPLPLLPSK